MRIEFSKNKIREYKENRIEKRKIGKELVERQRVLSFLERFTEQTMNPKSK